MSYAPASTTGREHSGQASPNPAQAFRAKGRQAKRAKRLTRDALTSYASPVAFRHREDARHGLTGNPNRAKRGAAQLDRDSATAKRDGQATRGAKLARANGAPLTSRAKRFGYVGTPALPLTTRGDHYAPREDMSR